MAKINPKDLDKSNNQGPSANITDNVTNIDESATYIDELVDTLVTSCCSELDAYIDYVKKLLDDVDTPINDVELDDIILTIPTLLYFTGNAQESMGIREDISKMEETNKYNNTFMCAEGTVQAKQAFAKLQTQNEALTSMVYQRACKKIKLRCDYALEILQSTKKILSRRLAELELSKNSLNRDKNN